MLCLMVKRLSAWEQIILSYLLTQKDSLFLIDNLETVQSTYSSVGVKTTAINVKKPKNNKNNKTNKQKMLPLYDDKYLFPGKTIHDYYLLRHIRWGQVECHMTISETYTRPMVPLVFEQ